MSHGLLGLGRSDDANYQALTYFWANKATGGIQSNHFCQFFFYCKENVIEWLIDDEDIPPELDKCSRLPRREGGGPFLITFISESESSLRVLLPGLFNVMDDLISHRHITKVFQRLTRVYSALETVWNHLSTQILRRDWVNLYLFSIIAISSRKESVFSYSLDSFLMSQTRWGAGPVTKSWWVLAGLRWPGPVCTTLQEFLPGPCLSPDSV